MGVQKKLGPGQCAWTPRGGAEPEIHRALLQGRGAGGRAELAAAGRLARECHFLTWSPRDFRRLLRGLRRFSSAGEEGRAWLSAFLDARGERGERGGGAGRGDGAGLRGSSSRRPLSCLQTASVKRKASILSLSPALTPSFFSCLTNPRIIQLRKRWKEVSEGGGRRVEIFGSSVPVRVRSGGSRWVG